MAVLHAEAAGDDAERMKTKALIQVPRMRVAGDDSVELQHAEAVRPALPQAVGHERFARVQAARAAAAAEAAKNPAPPPSPLPVAQPVNAGF